MTKNRGIFPRFLTTWHASLPAILSHQNEKKDSQLPRGQYGQLLTRPIGDLPDEQNERAFFEKVKRLIHNFFQ